MAELPTTDNLPLLPTMHVEPQARKLALRVVLISVIVFVALAPFAQVKLAPVFAFIPIYASALLINDLITAVMLFGHFSILRSRSLLVLACSYLFTAFITISHALTFPGLFSPTGLLGAGSQSTAWIYVFWHAGFPLCVIAYSVLGNRERETPQLIQHPHIAILSGIAVALIAAIGFTWMATANHDALPAILVSGHYTTAGRIVFTSTWICSALALAILWRHKKHSMLTLWLFVVMLAWLFDVALSAVLNAGRFDLGFYAGRIYGLLAASCVLIVLLLESNRLFFRLVVTHESALQRAADLQRLNTQNEDRATQYAKALEELHYKEEEVRAVVQNITDCVITIDSGGIVRSANPAVERIFGYPAADVIGRNIVMLIPAFRHDSYPFSHLKADSAKTSDARSEVEGLHRNGSRIPLELVINAFMVHGEHLFIGTIRDIGERQRFIAELKQASARAEQASKAKSAFLSSMSHELRTPLNAILGFAQIIGSDRFPVTDEKRKDFTAHIIKAGKHLLALINEVLDLSKVESGNLSLSPEPVALTEIMRTCREMIEPIADQRDIRMTFSVSDSHYVVADRIRLQQVLINLLSNAVKYNRKGGAVIVGCAAVSPERIRITIQDNGQGLDATQLEQLFQPFNRLGQETGAEEGTGIGLVLTKRLTEAMGGLIGVTSSVGIGSTFWIELKSTVAASYAGEKNAVSAHDPTVTDQAATEVFTVLYVEDNPANLTLIQEVIAFRSNVRLITATDAMEGIEMARTHQPAAILMDINLPGMSGNDAMLILRSDPATAHIPVIALSANAMQRDIARSMSAGFFRYITKPINIEEFFAVLDSALAFSAKPDK